MDRKLKRFKVLEVTNDDIAIGFWYENGEKEIIVVKKETFRKMIKNLPEELVIN